MLIDDLIEHSYLKTPEIIEAFRKIKREDFVLPEDKKNVEINAPLTIGFGQTISQPLTVAFMIELLQPKRGDKILDIGSGSGWTTAILAEIVGEKGKVYSIEIISDLKKFGEKNVNKYNFIKKGIVQFFCADGHEGLPGYAPFDKVLVSAAASEIPEKLLKQLKIGPSRVGPLRSQSETSEVEAGGRLVIPVGEQYSSQDIVAINKQGESKFKEKRYPGFVFVPLVKR